MTFKIETQDGLGATSEVTTYYRGAANAAMYKRENPPGTVLEDRAATAPELKTLESFEGAKDGKADGAKVVNGALVNIPNAVATMMTFDTVVFNDEGLIWDSDNPTRLKSCQSGVVRYFTLAGVIWDTNASGDRTIEVLKNGITVLDQDVDSGPGQANKRQIVGSYVDLDKDDYVELRVTQTSGATLGISAQKAAFSLNRALDGA